MLVRRPIVLVPLLVLLIAGCGGGGSSSEPAVFRIEGSWSGELHQKGLQPFRVSAEIRDLNDAKSNTVHYTGIDCGGNWTFLGRSGPAYRFREVINRGAGGNCKGVGAVQLSAQGADRLGYRFAGGGVQSSGILTRSG